MADDWILLIPEDPSVVQTEERQLRARQRFSEIAPDADDIKLVVSDRIEFFQYEWPQGFGRFALEAMNANIGELDEHRRHELEQLLATKLRVIYRHL